MTNSRLKYRGYSIVFQEVPDEISLAINISGCPHKCEDCHSKYLWNYSGEYIKNDIHSLINKYLNNITCVCFMGGDQNIEELKQLCDICKYYNLKTCLYTGSELDNALKSFALENLDYIKVGKYIKALGGLNSPTTNQLMYKINNNTFNNITNLFWGRNI